MTDQEINTAIAESFGWTKKPLWFPDGMGGSPLRKHLVWHYKGTRKDKRPPNYIKSLNACAEFEKTLGIKECHQYNEILCGIVVKPHLFSKEVLAPCFCWHATARQRCEAFLKTVGKWKGTNE